LAPAKVQGQYARLSEFEALLRKHDPEGKFRNEFLASNLYRA
jgi:xylitol oxidase